MDVRLERLGIEVVDHAKAAHAADDGGPVEVVARTCKQFASDDAVLRLGITHDLDASDREAVSFDDADHQIHRVRGDPLSLWQQTCCEIAVVCVQTLHIGLIGIDLEKLGDLRRIVDVAGIHA